MNSWATQDCKIGPRRPIFMEFMARIMTDQPVQQEMQLTGQSLHNEYA